MELPQSPRVLSAGIAFPNDQASNIELALAWLSLRFGQYATTFSWEVLCFRCLKKVQKSTLGSRLDKSGNLSELDQGSDVAGWQFKYPADWVHTTEGKEGHCGPAPSVGWPHLRKAV